jgi:glutathione S-transferase
MIITLYQFPAACSRVTMTALEEIGVPFDTVCVNIRTGSQTKPEYLAINPKGKVPAISIDGQIMTENAAILWMLHTMNPQVGLLPTLSGPTGAYKGLTDLSWCSGTIHPMVRQVRMPVKLTTGEPSGVREDGINKLRVECERVVGRVGNGGWWYGDTWSIIDTYLYWGYSTARKGSFPLEEFPALLDHAERVRARPSFQRVLAREQAAVQEHAITDVEL